MPVVACPSPCPPITRGIVQFLQSEFVMAYPEFTGISSGANQNAFNDAEFLLDNSCGSAVQDANKRMQLLYTLTAFVSFGQNGTNDGMGNVTSAPGIVGRIDSATQGSVSVSAAYSTTVGQSEAFFIQNKYGAKFWQQTMAYRTMHYIPAPQFGPNGPGFYGTFGLDVFE
jgi:Protein of unknown function (DUF4054)